MILKPVYTDKTVIGDTVIPSNLQPYSSVLALMFEPSWPIDGSDSRTLIVQSTDNSPMEVYSYGSMFPCSKIKLSQPIDSALALPPCDSVVIAQKGQKITLSTNFNLTYSLCVRVKPDQLIIGETFICISEKSLQYSYHQVTGAFKIQPIKFPIADK